MSGNGTEASTDDSDCEAEIYVQVLGTLIFFLVWPFIVLDMKWLPLGRPAAALCGGVFMVVFHILTQNEVYEIEGRMGNLQAIFLLVGMMLLSYYFDREGLLHMISAKIFGSAGKETPFRNILWKVCLLAGVLAAFITNDATCLVVTPLVLTEFMKQGRSRRELLPLAIGIASSANIGSSATVFGNPQNAFIASATGVALIDFFIALLPTALFGMAISLGLLHLIYFKIIFPTVPLPGVLGTIARILPSGEADPEEEAPPDDLQLHTLPEPGTIADERASVARSLDQSQDPFQSSGIAKERDIMRSTEKLPTSGSMDVVQSRSRYSLRSRTRTPRPGSVPPSTSNPNLQAPGTAQQIPEIHVEGNGVFKDGEKEKAVKEIVDEEPEIFPEDEEVVHLKPLKDRTIREKIFVGWLIGIFTLLVILLAIPSPPSTADFNLGLVPLSCAFLTMLADAILNKKYSYDAMLKIDWTVVLMFMGLFVWLGGFQNTCIPAIIVDNLAPYMNLNEFGGVIFFAVFVLIGSNIFSNVPLVILFVDRIDELCGDNPCKGPLPGLLLAWLATVAGNLTLIGSIANLIVAEKSRSIANFQLTFLRHLTFGPISTIAVAFGALPLVYFLGKLA